MSLNATARRAQGTQGRPSRTARPRLTPVAQPARRRKPKLAYAIVALGGALAIGAAQVGLSLAITQDSYALAALTSQQRTLDLQAAALEEELTGLYSPQALATNAAALGMVVAGSPSYLRLSDGAVLGTGEGTGWTSTVNPNGKGAVSNALLVPPAPLDATDGPVTDETADEGAQLPPAITDALPSPETH
ncbi:MAG: hypothetical protein QM630_07620 [Microbacterium sp.]